MIGSDHELLLWGIGRPVWAAGHRSSTEVLELCIDTPSGMSNKPSQAIPKPPVSGGLTGEQAKPQFCFFCFLVWTSARARVLFWLQKQWYS